MINFDVLKKVNLKYAIFIFFSVFYIAFSLFISESFFIGDLVKDYELIKSFDNLSFFTFFENRNFFGSILYNIISFVNAKLFGLSVMLIKIANLFVSYTIYALCFILYVRKKEIVGKDLLFLFIFSVLTLNLGLIFEHFSFLDVKLSILSSLLIYFLLGLSANEISYKKYIYILLCIILNILAFSFFSLAIAGYYIYLKRKEKNKTAILEMVFYALIAIVGLLFNLSIFKNISFSYSFIESIQFSLCTLLLPAKYYHPYDVYRFLYLFVFLSVFLTLILFAFVSIKKKSLNNIFICCLVMMQILIGVVFYQPDDYFYFTLFINGTFTSMLMYYQLYEVSKKEKPLNLYREEKFNFSSNRIWCIFFVIAVSLTYSYSFESRKYANRDMGYSKSEIVNSIKYDPNIMSTLDNKTIYTFTKEECIEAIDYYNANGYLQYMYKYNEINESYNSLSTCNRVYGFYYDQYDGDRWTKQRFGFEFYIENPFLEIELYEPDELDKNTIEIWVNHKLMKQKELSVGFQKVAVDLTEYVGKTVFVSARLKDKYIDPENGKEVGTYINSISTVKVAGLLYEEGKQFGWATDEFYYHIEKASDKLVINSYEIEQLAKNKAYIYLNGELQLVKELEYGANEIVLDTSKYNDQPVSLVIKFSDSYRSESDPRILCLLIISIEF